MSIQPTKDQLEALRNEILMSEKLNEEELAPIMRKNISLYVGKHIPAMGNDWDVILNEVYPIVQQHLSSIFFRNPKVFLKPRNKTYIVKKRNPLSGELENVQMDSEKSANTQESILNYILSQINFKQEVRTTLMDALLFPYGVMWHGYKGDFGMTEEQSFYIKNEQLFVQRINPLKFIHDPSCGISKIHMSRWVGRQMDVPLRDIVEDDKLNISKSLKGFHGFGQRVGRSTREGFGGKDNISVSNANKFLLDFTNDDFKKSMDSRFIKVYEIFLLASKKQQREGTHGWIILMTDEQDKPLRISEWKIKAEGFPSKILHFNELPDSIFGISDPDTYEQLINQKNIIINQQIQNAEQTGKVWIALSKQDADEEEIQAVQDGQNTIVTFNADDVGKKMKVASAGGQASSELYILDQRIQQNLDNQSGVNDLRRGVLRSGEESATSVRIRSSGQANRISYRQDIMADFLQGSVLYLNQLNKQFMTIKDAVRIIGSLDLQWSEDPNKEELQADVDAEIDVVSMIPENPQKEIEELRQVLGLMVQGISDPVLAQKISKEGKTINISPVLEQLLRRLRITNPEIFRNIDAKESEGFVSVRQMREAQANVSASVQGQQIPFPPQIDDDHRAKLEVYASIAQLLEAQGQTSDLLIQLIQAHQALAAEVQSQQSKSGQTVKLPKPSDTSI